MPPHHARRVARPSHPGTAISSPALELVWKQETPPRKVSRITIRMPNVLKLFMGLLLALTAVSLLLEWYWAAKGFGYPYTSPLVDRVSYFDDLLDWVGHMHTMHTAAYLNTPGMVAYMAPGMLLYWLLSLAGTHVLAAYMTVAAAMVGVAAWVFGRRLQRLGLEMHDVVLLLGVLALTSYPLVFTVTTANLEIVVWSLMAGGLWAYATGRYGIASTLIGVAISIKCYPAMLLLLFLRRRQWVWLVQAAASAAATTVVSLWAVYPKLGESWRAIYGSSGSTANFVASDCLSFNSGRNGFDHSLWSLVKTLTSPWTYTHSYAQMMTVLLAACAVVLALWLIRVQSMRLWERVTFLVCAMLLVMPMSNDYRLLALYVPFGMLVVGILRARVGTGLAIAALSCFAVLFTALGFVVVDATRFAGQVRCFALIGLFAAVTIWGNRSGLSIEAGARR
jgi:hypothetical protein